MWPRRKRIRRTIEAGQRAHRQQVPIRREAQPRDRSKRRGKAENERDGPRLTPAEIDKRTHHARLRKYFSFPTNISRYHGRADASEYESTAPKAGRLDGTEPWRSRVAAASACHWWTPATAIRS